MSYELTHDELFEMEELEECWYTCSESVMDEEFDLADFQSMAQNTYRWLEKFRTDGMIPKEIASLLMSIRHFVSATPYEISRESDAALCVAKAFCDIKHSFSIGGFPNNTFLSVEGTNGFHYIEPDTFDLTELIEDTM